MFQINSMLLRKMGWSDNSSPTFNSPRFNDNDVVKFYIRPGTIYIFIKELSEEEKQISKNSYKFVVGKREIQFNSNIEMLRLIIENEACNEDYKRHFKLNKILR
jgi:hypothetical protein